MHLSGSVAEIIQQAFHLYGIDVVFVGPIEGKARPLRLDLRDADLFTTGEVLAAMTHCLFTPVNAHLVLAVEDDAVHRKQYELKQTATIEVPNLQSADSKQKSDVEGLLAGVFGIVRPTVKGNMVTVRVPKKELAQIEDTLVELFQPEPQVLLEVKAYMVSRVHNRDLGVPPPQQIKIFDIASEAQSLITSNSSVVEELIAAGVVSAGDTIGILEALIAEGYGVGSVVSSPFVYFGGGNTAIGVQAGTLNVNATLSLSSSRQLKDATLHLANDQAGTVKVGQRYPIMVASTAALGGSTSTPTIQYEDLGLTLEAKPHIRADGQVLLHVHETFRSLDGTSLNTIPVIDNQELISDLSVPNGVTAVIVSNLSSSEARTAQGLTAFAPSDSSRNEQTSDLVVIVTPILTRRPGYWRNSGAGSAAEIPLK